MVILLQRIIGATDASRTNTWALVKEKFACMTNVIILPIKSDKSSAVTRIMNNRLRIRIHR